MPINQKTHMKTHNPTETTNNEDELFTEVYGEYPENGILQYSEFDYFVEELTEAQDITGDCNL